MRDSRTRVFFPAVLWASFSAFTLSTGEALGQSSPFRRGDANTDAAVDISDAVFILSFLFLGELSELPCEGAADSNGDGAIDLSDAVYVLFFLFQGGPAPPEPGPDRCGLPTAPSLGCRSYSSCRPAPLIDSGPTAAPPTVDEGASANLSVSASSPEGDPLSFSWSQLSPASPAGSFSDASAQDPAWTAPLVSGDTVFMLKVTVSDSQGGTAKGLVSVTVNNLNHPPAITEAPAAAPATLDVEESAGLSVGASDPDGEALSFAWSQASPASPQGRFSDAAAQGPTWTAPRGIAAPTVFTLQVVVSDGQGGTAQADVQVAVDHTNHPPVFTLGPTGTPSTPLSGDPVTLSVIASDLDGDPLAYSWVQVAPLSPRGSFTSGQEEARALWRAPEIGSETVFEFEVSVSDGLAPKVASTVSVAVRLPSYEADIQPIWTARCATCHSGPFASAGLNLAAGTSYNSLFNVSGLACSTLKRVSPGNPDSSMLVMKISGTSCGFRMPSGNPTFFDMNQGLLTRIRSWILSGARNN